MEAIDYKKIAVAVADELEARSTDYMMTYSEVGEFLKCSYSTIRRRVIAGELKPINNRFKKSDIDAYLKAA